MGKVNDQYRLEKSEDVTIWDYRDENSRTIASLATAWWGDGTYLFRVWVHPDHRRKGLATRLIREVLDSPETSNKVYLTPSPFLDSPMTVEQLQAWYQRLGFRPGEECVFYWDRAKTYFSP